MSQIENAARSNDVVPPIQKVPPLIAAAGVVPITPLKPNYQGQVGVRPEGEGDLDAFATDMQLAANYRALRKSLKGGAIGSLIFGAIAVAIAAVSISVNPLNIVLLLLGLALLAEGTWLFFKPMPIGIIVDGCLLIALGCWNIFISIDNAIAGGTPRFTVIAIMQIALGIYSFKRYNQVVEAGMIKPTDEVMTRLDQMAKDLHKLREKTDPDAMEMQIKGFRRQDYWRGRFVGAYAIFLNTGSHDLFFCRAGDVMIQSTGNAMLSKRLKITGLVKNKPITGTVTPEGLARFNAWKAATLG